jgi:hypothetical protein
MMTILRVSQYPGIHFSGQFLLLEITTFANPADDPVLMLE